MTPIDITILLVMAIFTIRGLFRGLILEVFTLAGFVIGYLLALREMSTLVGIIEKMVHLPPLFVSALSFIVIFLGVVLLVRWLAVMLKSVAKATLIGWLDKGGGAAFGLFKGALVMSLVLLLVGLLPLPQDMVDEQNQSRLVGPIRSVAPSVFDFVKKTFPKTKDFYGELKESFDKSKKSTVDGLLEKRLDSIQKEVKERVGVQ
ncbi:CvpA family protein [bacterium]|nr:CvpA family protein [bacterium]